MARTRSKRQLSELSRDFGRRLRAARAEAGLTQREFAERIGAAVPQISRYEAGVSLPNGETLTEIAKAINVGLDALLLGHPRDKSNDDVLIKDVRLLERLREIEKLNRKYRDVAVAMLEALIVQGNQDAVKERLASSRR